MNITVKDKDQLTALIQGITPKVVLYVQTDAHTKEFGETIAGKDKITSVDIPDTIDKMAILNGGETVFLNSPCAGEDLPRGISVTDFLAICPSAIRIKSFTS